MKFKFILFSLTSIILFTSLAFGNNKVSGDVKVTFYVQGNGKGWVELSCGPELGKGGNYAVDKNSRITITCKEGDILWDKKLKMEIIKISTGMQAKTIDLKKYY